MGPATLKLGRIPDRTPVKLTVYLPPELNEALAAYAAAYAEAYGVSLPVAELVPAMLAAFINSDRVFARRGTASGGARRGDRAAGVGTIHLRLQLHFPLRTNKWFGDPIHRGKERAKPDGDRCDPHEDRPDENPE